MASTDYVSNSNSPNKRPKLRHGGRVLPTRVSLRAAASSVFNGQGRSGPDRIDAKSSAAAWGGTLDAAPESATGQWTVGAARFAAPSLRALRFDPPSWLSHPQTHPDQG
jgi:hypothetical protein